MSFPQATLSSTQVAALVGGGVASPPVSMRAAVPVLPTNSTAWWSTDKTASVSIAVDTNVTFGGQPTLRIDIPAGVSGVIKVGTSTANANVPFGWNRNNAALVFKSSNLACVSAAQWYLGDSTYTNFWTFGGNPPADYPQHKLVAGDWMAIRDDAAKWVASGAPAIAAQMRSKIQFTATASASNESVWIAFAGAMPPKTKPTIILTFDDGFRSWYDFVAPLARYYDIPCTFAITCDLTGTANYMTAAQITELFNDESRLFDITNHSTVHTNYSTLGAAAYYANIVRCREFLRGIGITGDGPSHHPYVESVWGNDLLALMRAGGFLSARASAIVIGDSKDQLIPNDKLTYSLNICTTLDQSHTVAQCLTDIAQVVTWNGFGMVMAHDIAAADGPYTWSYAKTTELFASLAAARDAGTYEIKSWSRWYADHAGTTSDRR